jgi:hypothetical protein
MVYKRARFVRHSKPMKDTKETHHEYVVSWHERPAPSSKVYEAAHRRCLQIFDKDWKFLPSIKMHQFVVRVGDYGG